MRSQASARRRGLLSLPIEELAKQRFAAIGPVETKGAYLIVAQELFEPIEVYGAAALLRFSHSWAGGNRVQPRSKAFSVILPIPDGMAVVAAL